MRNTTSLLRLSFIASLFVLTLIKVPIAAADYAAGVSYFEKTNNISLIADSHDGTNSITGSVMPNRDSSRSTYGGAGAVGTRALGITPATSNQDRKQALYDFLRNKNLNGSDWEKMGSALIVHQMTGRQWGNGGRTIPANDQQWSELYARLVENTNVRMERYNYNWSDNTAGVFANGRYDAIKWKYEYTRFVDAWVFVVDGRPVYALEVICANPLGALAGLPDAQYDLTPAVSPSRTVIEAGDSVSVTHSVRNSDSVRSNETDWRLTKIEYGPGANLNNNDTQARSNDLDPCAAFPISQRVSCVEAQRSTREVFAANSTKVFNQPYTYIASANSQVGSRICFVASISRPTRSPSPAWRHSTLRCVIIAKKPKMQVWGGDIRAGGGIDTSTTTIGTQNRTTFGSWGEYGVLANLAISGFASGAGLNRGSAESEQERWSDLTFANINTSCVFGCYRYVSYAQSLISQFTSSSTARAIGGSRNLSDIKDLTGLSCPYRRQGWSCYTANNLTITGGTIEKGETMIIIATGTVKITGDINYSDGPYSGVWDIPQVIIKAPTIDIANSARNVDAWLIASSSTGSGILNTCADVGVSANLTAMTCNNTLRVNGPVIADKLYLRRTAGSAGGGPSSIGDPAEIFNLRADAYLWGSGYGSGNGRIQTVYSKELPPRF